MGNSLNRQKLSQIMLRTTLTGGVIVIILGVVAVQFLPGFINRIVDKAALIQEIEQGLNESTGVHFKIQELTLKPTLLHGIQVDLNTTNITDMQYHPLGDIRFITVQIRYLPILFEQLPEIAKIHVRNVHIPVGKYSLFKSLKLKLVKPKRTGFLKPAELKNTQVLISDYRIDDEVVAPEVSKLFASLKKPVQGFQVAGESIAIYHLESKKPIAIKGAGLLSFVQAEPKTGNQKIEMPKAHYQINLEMPQEAVKAKDLRYQDLSRLDFDMKGKDVDFQFRYKRPFKKSKALGSFHSSRMDFLQGQLLILQLADVAGFKLPAAVTETYIAGALKKADVKFMLNFSKPKKQSKIKLPNAKAEPAQPLIENALMHGGARLMDVSVARKTTWPQTIIRHMNGVIEFEGHNIQTPKLKFQLGELPILLRGGVDLIRKKMGLEMETAQADIGTVKKTLMALGVPLKQIEGRELQGTLNLKARVRGDFSDPIFEGRAQIQNGAYKDQALGLSVQHVNGFGTLRGRGLKTVRYRGRLVLNHADVESKAQQIALQDIKSEVAFEGELLAGKPPEIPKANGWLEVGNGQYTHPDTNITLTKIHGKALLTPFQYQIPHLQANWGSTLLTASGKTTPDFKHYRFHLVSRNASIPQLKRDVLAKLPGQGKLMRQLNTTGGLANLDLTIEDGNRMNGRLNVTAFNAQLDHNGYPLRVPNLTVRFDNRGIFLQPATLYYGPIAAHLEGQFHSKQNYRFGIKTDEIPVAMLRDSMGLINVLSDAKVPEIWNAAGSFRVDSALSNQVSTLRVSFNQAGLSWQGGDFPLYDMNGHLFYRRNNNGEDFLGTRDLSLYYGNSPISIKAGSGEHFRMRTEGILSALVVNHFLVSSQSNATPYKQMPFQFRAQGVLAGLPGAPDFDQNKIAADLHVDLNPSIKDAYKDMLPTPPHLKPPEIPDNAKEPPNRLSDTLQRNREQATRAMTDLLSGIQEKVQAGLARFTGESLANESADESGETKAEQPLPVAPNARIEPESPVKDERQTETPKEKLIEKPAETSQNSAFNNQQLGLPKSAAERVYQSPTSSPSVSQPSNNTSSERRHLSLDRPPSVDTSGADDNAYLNARLLLSGNNLMLEQAKIHLFEAGEILAEGAVQDMLRPEKRLFGFHLYTQPEISLGKLSHSSRDNDFFRNANGTLVINTTMNGGEKLENMWGWLRLNGVAIPYLTLDKLTARIDFLGDAHAKAEVSELMIPGMETTASATTENLFELPVTLENVKINGKLMSIDSIRQFNDVIVTPILIEQLVHNFTRPWQQGDPRIPIQFRDADMHFDELILQNIIMSKLNSKFSVYANSFFELTNASLEAAGGKVNGYFSMNPNESNFMTLELNADNIKANALTRALLNVTNQIFGDLSGTVRFTTFGLTDVEMQDNANGTVHARVTNGRLPAIAKVETLLATANLLRGGLLGFNLNNLFRSLSFYDTNYFAELSGDLLVANGVLYTDNAISDGENLDLVIQGSLDMGNGDADMLVNGRMSQTVSGKLGPLGKLSIGSIVQYVPALGTFGRNQPGLLGYLPGVGYVPGLGGPASDFNYFQVRLVGQLDDPAAIRDFHWVRKAP